MFDFRCMMFDVRRAALIAALAGAGIGPAFADSPSVTAVLSSSEAAVGETVQLQIQVTGSGAKAPGEIQVDGVEIQRTGTEQHYEMRNFSVSQSVIYNYTLLPTKAGKFKIPPQTIEVDGKPLRTPELVLNVVGSSSRAAGGNTNAAPQSTIDPKQLGFIELIVPKREAYVGEIVPIVVKICLNPRVRFQQVGAPEINAQGLTMQKLEQAGRGTETINGAMYDVVTFKTAFTAARGGKFEIPPVEAKALAILSRRSSSTRSPGQRPRSPLDMFNMDPFDDPFFSSVIGEPRKLTLSSEPTSLEIKPLPPNAPPSFSGAVGNFAMTSEVKPKTVQVGDPITVTSTIAGRGNFDRVDAPVISDEAGWHKYPPSSKFEKDDEIGISGKKTFETVLSPNEKKETVPPLLFSYFDPVKEQYVSLHSDAVPVQVEGNALPSPAVAATTPAANPDATTKPGSKPQDILYQIADFGPARSFTPFYNLPIFWMAQLVPLLGLLGVAGWNIRQARINNREAQRTTRLQQEVAHLMRSLRRNDSSPQEYFSQASRAVQVKAALASRSGGIDPNMVDEEVAAKTFTLDENERAQLGRLFAQSNELRYSGGDNGGGTSSPQDRQTILELIENLRA
jgi:hypothetical protein